MSASLPPPQAADRTRFWFRLIAFAEALSWAGLLVGMYLKYVPESTEVGVQVFGPIHGGIFLVYLAACFVARSVFGWSLRTTLVALVSAVPPFATAVFEVVADRRGLLAAGTPAAPSLDAVV